jgi:hypothetical protein
MTFTSCNAKNPSNSNDNLDEISHDNLISLTLGFVLIESIYSVFQSNAKK